MEPEQSRLRANLETIEERILRACRKSGRVRDSIRLVAVTKTHPVETVQALIDIGVKDIGENRLQEMAAKAPHLRGDFTLHMVGHLQTNKVALALRYAFWIQSIDSLRLVDRIEHCHGGGEKVHALIEVNTSGEPSKSGCTPQECRQLCERVAASSALMLCGLMTIGPLNGNESLLRRSFEQLRHCGDKIADLAPDPVLSMGMSDDFEWAIEEGSTMIRIGTALLGRRTA